VVYDYLRGETESGMLVGPLQREAVPGVHINRFKGSKTQQPGKW